MKLINILLMLFGGALMYHGSTMLGYSSLNFLQWTYMYFISFIGFVVFRAGCLYNPNKEGE